MEDGGYLPWKGACSFTTNQYLLGLVGSVCYEVGGGFADCVEPVMATGN